jgi:uncharacterized protein involved in exopolysaccharide biosynthesis
MSTKDNNNLQTGPKRSEKLLGTIFRRRRLIGASFIAVTALAFVVTYSIPRQYESSMKLLVKSERTALTVSPDARESATVPNEVTESQVNSEIELLGSYDLLRKVVKACHLERNGAGATGAPQGREVEFEKAVQRLKHDLRITPVLKTNFIDVTYSAGNPEGAANVLRELATAYLDMHLSVHRSAGTQEFFEQQTTRYGDQLRNVETRLNEFRLKNNLTSVAEEKELLVHKLLDSEAALKEAQTGLAESSQRLTGLRTQFAGLSARIVTQSRTVPNQYSVERLNTMLVDLENRRTQALMKFPASDRIVIEVDQEITNTRAALENTAKLASTEQVTDVNPLHASMENDLTREELTEAGLKVRCKELTGTVADYHAHLAQLQNDTLEYDGLQRGMKESEENYLLYSRKQEDARIADSLDRQKVANVAVAEAPLEHYLPAKPNIGLSLAIGILLAAILSLGAGFGMEYASGCFHAPADLENTTGLPVLATVAWRKA